MKMMDEVGVKESDIMQIIGLKPTGYISEFNPLGDTNEALVPYSIFDTKPLNNTSGANT